MVKETSWLYVLITPSRWIEALKYLFSRRPKNFAGACDIPDPRDLNAKYLFTSVPALPLEFSLDDKAKFLGWSPTKQSLNSCSAYSKGHGVEITNTIEHQDPVLVDKEIQWAHQEATGGSRIDGDTIQNAEKCFHKNPQGFPQTEYRRLRSKEDTLRGIKLWLLRMETIRTGVYWKWSNFHRNTNSGFMIETGFFTPGDGQILGGHAVDIVGWDDSIQCPDGSHGALRMLESELIEWGDNEPGIFWVPYVYIDRLFSKYISRDAIDR